MGKYSWALDADSQREVKNVLDSCIEVLQVNGIDDELIEAIAEATEADDLLIANFAILGHMVAQTEMARRESAETN